jgi:hypothetical protein
MFFVLFPVETSPPSHIVLLSETFTLHGAQRWLGITVPEAHREASDRSSRGSNGVGACMGRRSPSLNDFPPAGQFLPCSARRFLGLDFLLRED